MSEAIRDERAEGEPKERREAILEAAARVIARSGVRGLRVEEVASEAAVSPPLLYYHFASRSGLIRAALEHASEHAPSAALRRTEPAGADGYSAVLNALLGELDDDRAVKDNAIVWGEVSASAVFEPALRDDVRKVADEWCETVSGGIERGQADGSIRGDIEPARAAAILVTLVDGLCTRWLAEATPRDRARELLESAVGELLSPR